jgi:hypothetical protein
MQGSSAVLILQMNACTPADERANSLHLPFFIPGWTGDEPIRGVMQWAALPMILCSVWIRTGSEQQLDNLHTMTGGSKMQSCIASVYPVKDLVVIELRLADKACRESTISLKQLDGRAVIVFDYSN